MGKGARAETSDALAEIDKEARYPVQDLRHRMGIHVRYLLCRDHCDVLGDMRDGLRMPCGGYHEILFLVKHLEDLHLLFNLS